MKIALVVLALLAPAQTFASCESGLVVNTRELAFSYYDAIPMDVADFPPAAEQAHFRGMAHALAVAKACADTARMYTCDAGTPPRTRIMLWPGGGLTAPDSSDSNARWILERCANADADSACVLWTCEIGRFRTQRSARDLADGASVASEAGVLEGKGIPSRDAVVIHDSCGGTWEPWSYVVHLGKGVVAPWAARTGLFFSRKDAEREAARWYEGFGMRPRVVRQRVDGALLQEALRQPMEGC